MSKQLQKLIATAIMATMMFSLTACGNKNKKEINKGITEVKG